MSGDIPAEDKYPRHVVSIQDIEMSYIDTGLGDPVVFLHGNPTSSYLWRNVIPHLEHSGRCLAPDLLGMGDTDKSPHGVYRFVDHSRYLDAWFDAVNLGNNVTLVLHDWGSALGFHWANRNRDRVKGIVYMEAIVQPLTWDMWPEASRSIFQGMRGKTGEKMILERNLFVERILPGSIIRELTQIELDTYRKPYLNVGEDRLPTLVWPREIPIDGMPEDVHNIVGEYACWLSSSPVRKLFINADPGAILTGSQREFCRTWQNQDEVTVPGIHFLQEDCPADIGSAIFDWYKSL